MSLIVDSKLSLKICLLESKRADRKLAKTNKSVIIDDNELFVVIPRSGQACRLYSRGTKWCISSDESFAGSAVNPDYLSSWEEYDETFSSIMIIIKKGGDQAINPLDKIAVEVFIDHKDGAGKLRSFDAANNRITASDVYDVLGSARTSVIIDAAKKEMKRLQDKLVVAVESGNLKL